MEDYIVTIIAAFAGALASMLFQWFPEVQEWYDKYSPGQKAGIMAGLMLLVSAALYGLSCSGWLNGLIPGLTITCDQEGLQLMIRAFIFAVFGNQTTYQMIKKTGAGKDK